MPVFPGHTSSARPLRERKRQTRLLFSPLPSSSPAKDQYSRAVQDSLAGVSYDDATHSPDPNSMLSPESSSAPGEIAVPDRMSARETIPSSPTSARVQGLQVSDDTDEDDLVTPAQKRRKTANTSPSIPTPESHPRRRSKRLHPGSSTPPNPRSLMSSEDEVEEPSSSLIRRSGRLRRESSPPAHTTSSATSRMHMSSDLQEPTLSDLGSPENSDDDDFVMATKPTIRRKSKFDREESFSMNNDTAQRDIMARTPTTRRSRSDDFVVDDDDIEYVSSEDEGPRTNAKKSALSHHVSSQRRILGKRKARTQREQEELDDDLHDLQDSDNETPNTRTGRTRGGPVTTQRDSTREHFERLKRRRAGEKITRVVDSDNQTDEEGAGADLSLIGEPHYEALDQSVSSDTDPEATSEDAQQDEDEDDFIEHDTQGRLGRPNTDIPLQFTSFASKKPKELFIHIVEWITKNKIAPAFNRDDPVYNLAFARVDDQVKAQAGSRLISPAWTTDFKHTILARPHMKIVALPGEDEEHMRTCDACNRINNPARYEFVLSGEPYYAKTLEPVDNMAEDEEDEETINSVTYDEAGHVIASEHTCFYLGRFCAANAEMGHKLTHWKYHLNETLIAYLESQGVLSSDSILAREKMSKKKREKQAEDIVDSMEETGVIAEFWSEFQNDLNDARLGMVDYERKGGRTKGRAGAIRAKSGGLVREWDKDKFRVGMALESDSDEY